MSFRYYDLKNIYRSAYSYYGKYSLMNPISLVILQSKYRYFSGEFDEINTLLSENFYSKYIKKQYSTLRDIHNKLYTYLSNTIINIIKCTFKYKLSIIGCYRIASYFCSLRSPSNTVSYFLNIGQIRNYVYLFSKAKYKNIIHKSSTLATLKKIPNRNGYSFSKIVPSESEENYIQRNLYDMTIIMNYYVYLMKTIGRSNIINILSDHVSYYYLIIFLMNDRDVTKLLKIWYNKILVPKNQDEYRKIYEERDERAKYYWGKIVNSKNQEYAMFLVLLEYHFNIIQSEDYIGNLLDPIRGGASISAVNFPIANINFNSFKKLIDPIDNYLYNFYNVIDVVVKTMNLNNLGNKLRTRIDYSFKIPDMGKIQISKNESRFNEEVVPVIINSLAKRKKIYKQISRNDLYLFMKGNYIEKCITKNKSTKKSLLPSTSIYEELRLLHIQEKLFCQKSLFQFANITKLCFDSIHTIYDYFYKKYCEKFESHNKEKLYRVLYALSNVANIRIKYTCNICGYMNQIIQYYSEILKSDKKKSDIESRMFATVIRISEHQRFGRVQTMNLKTFIECLINSFNALCKISLNGMETKIKSEITITKVLNKLIELYPEFSDVEFDRLHVTKRKNNPHRLMIGGYYGFQFGFDREKYWKIIMIPAIDNFIKFHICRFVPFSKFKLRTIIDYENSSHKEKNLYNDIKMIINKHLNTTA